MSEPVYKNNTLYVENVSVQHIAEKIGTPLYVYSKARLGQQLAAYVNTLKKHSDHQRMHRVCYAVKANSNLSILQHIASAGAGFDIVSVGELERVLCAGGRPENVVFSGVGKLPYELKRALDVGISCFNIESEAELLMLQQVASEMGEVANISLRVNPDVDAQTHPYISTGLKDNKFGIDILSAEQLYLQAAACSHLNIKGIDCHIGSQLTTLRPFLDAMDRVLDLVDRLEVQGVTLSHLDMGGGLGIPYDGEEIPSVEAYIDALCAKLGQRPLSLILEPGRSLIAEAGLLITQVILLKNNGEKKFAVVDAGMNDLVRPSLYQATHRIDPVSCVSNEPPAVYDIVGPVCETADCFDKQQVLSLKPNDYLAIMDAGAYGMCMASNYNSRPRAAEVMVDNTHWEVIRRRETLDDMLAMEVLHSSGG